MRAGSDGNWYWVVKYPAGTYLSLSYNDQRPDGKVAVVVGTIYLTTDRYVTYHMAQCDSSDDTCAMDATLGLTGRWSNAGATAALIVTAPETLLAAGIVAPAAVGDVVAAAGDSYAAGSEAAGRGLIATDTFVPGGVKGVLDTGMGFLNKNNPPRSLPGLLGAAARDIFDILMK